MHIPAYAYPTIRSALPHVPTSRQLAALDCCLCDRPFDDRGRVPLGPTPESGLFGCHLCLRRFVARARRARDASLTRDAERAQAEAAAWLPVRERHLARLERMAEAAEAVARLVRDGSVEPLRMAWLLVSLESANGWLPDVSEPPAAERGDHVLKDAALRLQLAMIGAREAVAERLAYHVINQAQPVEPEMCAEFECPDGCTGRHESVDIDCGPDAVFDDLAEHGITLERPVPEPPSFAPAAPRRSTGTEGSAGTEEEEDSIPDMEDYVSPVLLARLGIDVDDPDVLLDAAAVGLVVDAWREGPLQAIHRAEGGPSDAEMFAQGVDLYHRARTALAAAKDDGPERLLAFVAVASDVDLPWAGGSRFALRAVPGTGSESVAEFIRHVDDRVWFTGEVMLGQGWRAALLHRAASAALKARSHFGMPGWPGVVASAMERLTPLDRSGAPVVLAEPAAVEAALLEAPDRLGVGALGWLLDQGVFG